MRSITEFAPILLQKVLSAKNTLTTEGKTPEEVSQSVGESCKLEGDKLKYALAAADLIKDKTGVRRVLVVSFAEGEDAPAKYQKVEENYYLVETLELNKPAATQERSNERRGPKKGGPKTPKSSPWGMSPEEKAAKNKGANKAKPS